MKLFFTHLVVTALALFLPCGSLLFGADFDFYSETIVSSYERSVDDTNSTQVLPVYEYLGLDYGDKELGGFSLHMYGWVRKAMSGPDYYESDPDAELLYGYVQYAKPYNRFRVNLGRQHIFSGIMNESIDGLDVETGLGSFFSARAYGGLSVTADADDFSHTPLIAGGRLAHHYGSIYEIGISYQNISTTGETARQTAGADVGLRIASWLILNGLSSYNIETRDWREHNIDASVIIGPFTIQPAYQYFQYSDYFDVENKNNTVFAFLKNSDETLAVISADVMWQPVDRLEIGVRGRNYSYAVRNEAARYYAGLMTFDLSQAGSQIGAEIGRMDGETSENIYTLFRGFFYWQNPFNLSAAAFISGDALYVSYDAPVYGKDSSLYGSLGAGRTFLDDRLEIKLSITYSQDPYFDSDVGGLMTIKFKL